MFSPSHIRMSSVVSNVDATILIELSFSVNQNNSLLVRKLSFDCIAF